MSTTTKKSKIKKNSEIKVEKVELQSLGAYVNDRVELIRQVFSCLKTKYIKSICPEVLAGRSTQEIQECCLDELLGISKKRLLAILNATECPSDTDSSSDNGSNGKEYISLEEISSDDEMNEKTAGNADNKEISVLELLELQARARAIRSQLALEPVTKIELDSDKEDESSSSSSSVSLKLKPKEKPAKSKSNVKRPTDIQKMFEELDNTDENEVTSTQRCAPQPQPIRFKRNFLKRENRPSSHTVSNDNKVGIQTNSKPTTPKSAETTDKVFNDSKDHSEKIDEAGNSSPDIITVVQSPETFSIMDSEDEKENDNVDSKETINNEVISSVEILQKSSARPDEIPEEGEIVEENESEQEVNLVAEKTLDVESESEKIEKSVETNLEQETVRTNPVESKPTDRDLTMLHTDTEQNVEPNVTVDLANEELDYELKDDSEIESDSEDKSQKFECEKNESETIEIFESSEEESSQPTINDAADVNNPDKDCLSFHERWLGSKKVSKILATSRLGNRLRENIKSKKAAERANILESPTCEQATEKPSEHEAQPMDYDVDSVEHYQNLLSNVEKNEITKKIDETPDETQEADKTETAVKESSE